MLTIWRLSFLLCATSATLVGGDLSTLQSVENTLEQISPDLKQRENNVDVIPASVFKQNVSVANTTQTEEKLAVCHMINMNTYLEVIGLGPIAAATTALALEHLNSGNGAVVKEVEGLNERCPIRFSTEFLDTKNSPRVAMGQLNSIFAREEHLPCAFLGNSYSSVSVATSVQTGIYDVVQVSVTSSTAQLDDKDLHPLFARTGPSSSDFIKPLLDFLYHHLNIRHLAVIASDDKGQSSLASGLIDAQSAYPDLDPIARITLPTNAEERNYAAAITALKETGFRYVMVFVRPEDYMPLIEEAVKEGVAGTGVHNWMFNGISVPSLLAKSYPKESAFAQAMRGSLNYIPKSSMAGFGRYDAFVKEIDGIWNNEEDRQFLTTKLPSEFTADPFASRLYAHTDTAAAMMYDSAILVGLAACNANHYNFTGSQHYQSMLNTTFDGASGKVVLNKETGSRDVSTTSFSLTNFVPTESASSDGLVNFTGSEFAAYFDGKWTRADDRTKQTGYTIVFNDGTTNIPPDLPPVDLTTNFISEPAKILGFALSAIVIVAAVTFSLWTKVQHRKKKYVVMAAQPMFLQLICGGSFLMGVSIIPMGLDRGILEENATCMATPWLLSLGWCIVFSSLFSKTLRVNKVFHNPNFRRVVVHASDVVRPMATMMALNVVILAVWTIVSPLEWQSNDVMFDSFGRLQEISYKCTSDYNDYFVVPLLVVNVAALLFANYQAFVARKIATEFAESEYIGSAMGLILVVFSITIPVKILAQEGDSSVRFFVDAGFVFTVSMSVLVFIFVPKILQDSKPTLGRDTVRHAIRRSITSSSAPKPNLQHQTSFDETPSLVGSAVVNHPKIASSELVVLKSEIEKLKETNLELQKRLNECA